MSTVVRMYDSEEHARDALAMLSKEGFGDTEVFHFQPDAGDATEVVSRAVDSELIPRRYGKACRNALAEGHHVVAVAAAFGTALMAEEILDSYSPVNTDQLPEYEFSSSPTILSDLLGWAPLSRRKFVMTSRLSRPGWMLSNVVGMKLLSKNGAPLSSMFGMKLLTTPKSKTSSFGLPLLSKNGTPLSSMLRLRTLKKTDPDKFDSFGIPLISHDPTPLSSMFGFKVLSHDGEND